MAIPPRSIAQTPPIHSGGGSRLSRPGLSGTADVDTDVIRFQDCSLADYFASLAADWRGWSGTWTWGRDALVFEASHDGLGHSS